MSKDVYVVHDETGEPVFCASWSEACHEHINDAINEYGVAEASAWKVALYRRYEMVPCHTCNSMRVAVPVLLGDTK